MDQSSKKKTVTRKAVKEKKEKVAGKTAPANEKSPVQKKAAPGKKATTKKVAVKKAAGKPAGSARTAMSSISITAEDRWKMIAIAAYHKAEARGFAPGGEVQDWLEAEKEIDILIVR